MRLCGSSTLEKWILPLCLAGPLMAGNATVAGEVSAPYPTILNLSLEWRIEGDDNFDGRVGVEYRRSGGREWKEGPPLLRIPAGNSGRRTNPTFYWENKHSGSLFDLEPNTEYEIRLRLRDPDGGATERTLRAKTRAVPRPAPGSPVRAANAGNFKEVIAAVEPGEIVELAPGYYGEFEMTADGVPGKPIVIRGDVSHTVRSTFDAISLRGRKHVILERLTVQGSVDLLGAEEVAVRHSTVNAKYGIIAKRKPGCTNCYIADNVVTYVMPWAPEGMGAGSPWGGAGNVGEGIEITGPGNVICHNRVKGYRDCISTMEDRNTYEQISIDIYNNDLYVGVDDGVEADFCMGNCRVMRNRMTNCGMGVSAQPSLGGPTYFIRNVMYNLVLSPFKLSRGSGGNVVLHNTAVKTGHGLWVPHGNGQYYRSTFRNNLCIGGLRDPIQIQYSGPREGAALVTPEADPTNDFDYDGVGTHLTPFRGNIGAITFSSLEELRQRTTEKHAVQVDLGVFEKVEFPNPPYPERPVPDLRLKAGSKPIDAGLRLPGVNDGYRDAAPDLGAYEFGEPLPHYGPRPEGVDEETARGAR